MQKCSITVHRKDQNQENIMLLYRNSKSFCFYSFQMSMLLTDVGERELACNFDFKQEHQLFCFSSNR